MPKGGRRARSFLAWTVYTWTVGHHGWALPPSSLQMAADDPSGSYGRFNQGVSDGWRSARFTRAWPLSPPATSMKRQAGHSIHLHRRSERQPVSRSPHSDAPHGRIPIGVDRELAPRLAVALAYIRKNGTDFIGWIDVGGLYCEETRTLEDGRTLPVSVLTNRPDSRRFLLTNPDDYSLTYNGLVIVVEKRRSNGWQALASYTLSRTTGLQVSSGANAGDPQVSPVAPAFPSTTFGRDPNNLTNAYGRLPNDRPHMFRLMGTTDVPRTGFAVGASLQYFSGKPWAATTQIALPQGDQRILLEPRGWRRLSSQSLLDVRVSRRIPFGRMGHVELLLDVLNVLNDTAEESLATDNLFSPNFAQSALFIDPRRAMVGVRLNLGR